MRFQIQTYGCQMNVYDSARLEKHLEEAGHVRVENENEAEIILLNTCSVRDSAESRIFGRLGQLLPLKRSGSLRVLGLCGCMAQSHAEAIFERAPHVDLVVGTEAGDRIARLIDAVLTEGTKQTDIAWAEDEETSGLLDRPFTPSTGTYPAFVSVMRGCNRKCTYCIVPSVRGGMKHRDPESIVEEVRNLARSGIRWVTLIGQVVDAYRWEGICLAGLLERVAEVEGIDRIGFVTSHPAHFSDALIEACARIPSIVRYFHIPIQSGSNRILREMKRGYTREDYLFLMDRIRKAIPDAAVTSDLIVGFPGETEEDFEQSFSILHEVRWDGVFAFRFSKRKGTPAAAMPDQVPEPVKIERLEKIIHAQKIIGNERNAPLVGTEQEVFVESVDSGIRGRTWQNKATVIEPAGRAIEVGETRRVRIERATAYTLYGR